MIAWRPSQQGFSLVELVVAIGIVGVLLALAAPSYRSWTQNTKIRGTTEAILNGIQLAKAEAVRRNTTLRFQLVSTLDNTCVLGTAGSSASYGTWIISRDDPTNPNSVCDTAPLAEDADLSNAVAPAIIRVRPATEGSSNVVVVAGTAPGVGQPSISFNGLGRVLTGPLPLLPSNLVICAGIDVSAASTPVAIVTVSGVNKCATSPTERRMQVTVTTGGEVRMCDPAFTSTGASATDPQRCF
jgi:type IV fimbrial biogenesis protein FimT